VSNFLESTHECHDNTPQRKVRHFIPRQTSFDIVKSHLFGESRSPIVILQGMGGSGKTQLAYECSEFAKTKLSFVATLWIDASSPTAIVRSYKEIDNIIAKPQSVEGAKVDGEMIVSRVCKTIQELRGQWLVVFDSYDNPLAFQKKPIEEYIPRGKNGAILFTSRHQTTARLGTHVPIRNMTQSESVELLLNKKLRDLDEEEKRKALSVVLMLGHLPLALDQAAAYISVRQSSLDRFISEYKARRRKVLSEIPDQWEYLKRIGGSEERNRAVSVFTTWELSLQMIQGSPSEQQHKETFLTLVAFFNHSLISERYFEEYCKSGGKDWVSFLKSNGQWDTYKLGDFLAECANLSLLYIHKQRTNELQFSFHVLISEWLKLREKRRMTYEFVTGTAKILEVYLRRPINYRSLPLHIILETVSHVDACIINDKIISKEMSNVGLDSWPEILALFTDFYRCVGFSEKAVAQNERFRKLETDIAKRFKASPIGTTTSSDPDDQEKLQIVYKKNSLPIIATVERVDGNFGILELPWPIPTLRNHDIVTQSGSIKVHFLSLKTL
jgi:NB-ARC domain